MSGESGSPDAREKTSTCREDTSLSSQFRQFSKFGDTKSDGSSISLSQSDKWMKQAGVIDGKTLTTTDTGIAFKKLKQPKLNLSTYEKLLSDLATTKKMDVSCLIKKMAECGPPGTRMSFSSDRGSSVYDRLTDPSKYTASHKERFDESGRGRGLAGRRDQTDASGYVQGYKNRNSYPAK